MKTYTSNDKMYLKYSYFASIHIVTFPYTIGEMLLEPFIIDICTELFDNEQEDKINKIVYV